LPAANTRCASWQVCAPRKRPQSLDRPQDVEQPGYRLDQLLNGTLPGLGAGQLNGRFAAEVMRPVGERLDKLGQRALDQGAVIFFTQPVPELQAAMASKIIGTQAAFEVAGDALQIFCGAGTRRDRPFEEIFRDARGLSIIEDGCNEILAIKGGRYLADGRTTPGPGNG
jgi:hypothetical protein